MSLKSRHEKMLGLLRREKSISVARFAELMDVSEVTIRKDLSYLESMNLLYRAYGGAKLISPTIGDRHISEKESLNAEQKDRIATYAASLIEKNDTIIIGSGTSVSYLAHKIVPQGRLTVITASIPVATILSKHDNVDVVMLGGMLRHSSLSVVGNFAEKMMQHFSCSKVFLGVDGVEPEFGLSTTNTEEATLNILMMKSAEKRIVLSDSSKFGLRGLSKICDIKDVDQIITDTDASTSDIMLLESLGVDIIQC